MVSTNSNSNSPAIHTCLTLLSAFDQMSLPLLLAHRTPTCLWTMLPTSLGIRANYTNDEHAARFNMLAPLIEKFWVKPLEVSESVVGKSSGGGGEEEGKWEGRTLVEVRAEGRIRWTEGVRKEAKREAMQQEAGGGGGEEGFEKGEFGEEAERRVRNEYLFRFWMDERGEKVERVEEWVDSKLTGELLGVAARARELLMGAAKGEGEEAR